MAFPRLFPFPPAPPAFPGMRPLISKEEVEEEEEVAEPSRSEKRTETTLIKETTPGRQESAAREFRELMRDEGYNEELIDMGVRVMLNHIKSKREAFQIGENYIKTMSK